MASFTDFTRALLTVRRWVSARSSWEIRDSAKVSASWVELVSTSSLMVMVFTDGDPFLCPSTVDGSWSRRESNP